MQAWRRHWKSSRNGRVICHNAMSSVITKKLLPSWKNASLMKMNWSVDWFLSQRQWKCNESLFSVCWLPCLQAWLFADSEFNGQLTPIFNLLSFYSVIVLRYLRTCFRTESFVVVKNVVWKMGKTQAKQLHCWQPNFGFPCGNFKTLSSFIITELCVLKLVRN